MDYFDTKLNRVYTEYGIVERGLPLDNTILSSVGIYPLDYAYKSYNDCTQKQLPDGDPVFNGTEYVQYFKVEELTGVELEQAQERKHRIELSEEEKTLLKYLDNTDWYVVRFSEKGEPIPEEITVKREESRIRIDEIRNN